jgi:hypothetical protein
MVEMFAIAFSFVLWSIAIRTGNKRAVESARVIWYWVMGFSSLMIANFIHQYVYVYDQAIIGALVAAKFTFVPLLASWGLGLILSRRARRSVNG